MKAVGNKYFLATNYLQREKPVNFVQNFIRVRFKIHMKSWRNVSSFSFIWWYDDMMISVTSLKSLNALYRVSLQKKGLNNIILITMLTLIDVLKRLRAVL